MKKVFVALTDKNFIEHSKSLFHSAKVDGEWDGDFVLIVPEKDKDSYDFSEFYDRGIDIFFGPTLIGDPPPTYYRFYLFTEYFKKWDWIFYCDIDVLFFNKIDFNFKDRKLDVMYANDCNGMVLYQQFEYENEKIDINNNEVVDKVKWLYENYKESPSFQACFLLFHKNLIKDETFDNLLNCHTLYHVYYELTRDGLTEEQAILNLEFYNRWEELSDKFLNAYPRADELKWEFDKMGEAFEDDRDYKKDGLMAIHFYQFFQPWSKHNLRFYPIWKEYNDKF